MINPQLSLKKCLIYSRPRQVTRGIMFQQHLNYLCLDSRNDLHVINRTISCQFLFMETICPHYVVQSKEPHYAIYYSGNYIYTMQYRARDYSMQTIILGNYIYTMQYRARNYFMQTIIQENYISTLCSTEQKTTLFKLLFMESISTICSTEQGTTLCKLLFREHHAVQNKGLLYANYYLGELYLPYITHSKEYFIPIIIQGNYIYTMLQRAVDYFMPTNIQAKYNYSMQYRTRDYIMPTIIERNYINNMQYRARDYFMLTIIQDNYSYAVLYCQRNYFMPIVLQRTELFHANHYSEETISTSCNTAPRTTLYHSLFRKTISTLCYTAHGTTLCQ